MSKKRKNRYRNNWQDHYWQSSLVNSMTYQMYRDQILQLCMNRYRWVNLPKTCDARYLEWTLAMEGVATIAKPKDGLEAWVSTKCATGRLNIYDNPVSWRSTGNNGWDFSVTPENGVLVWDNSLRYPKWNQIHLWALRLAEYDRVADMNLQQQKIPWVVKAPQERVLDATNMVKQALGGEPAILGFRSIDQVDFDVLMTPVEFKGEQFYMAKQKIWNEIYTALGIKNVDQKQERMIEAEVKDNDDPTELLALDGLRTRRQAARYLNDHFDLDISVMWNRDIESTDWNYLHDIRAQQEIGEPEGAPTDDSQDNDRNYNNRSISI